MTAEQAVKAYRDDLRAQVAALRLKAIEFDGRAEAIDDVLALIDGGSANG